MSDIKKAHHLFEESMNQDNIWTPVTKCLIAETAKDFTIMINVHSNQTLGEIKPPYIF